MDGGLAGPAPNMEGLGPLRQAAEELLGGALAARDGAGAGAAWAAVERDTLKSSTTDFVFYLAGGLAMT